VCARVVGPHRRQLRQHVRPHHHQPRQPPAWHAPRRQPRRATAAIRLASTTPPASPSAASRLASATSTTSPATTARTPAPPTAAAAPSGKRHADIIVMPLQPPAWRALHRPHRGALALSACATLRQCLGQASVTPTSSPSHSHPPGQHHTARIAERLHCAPAPHYANAWGSLEPAYAAPAAA